MNSPAPHFGLCHISLLTARKTNPKTKVGEVSADLVTALITKKMCGKQVLYLGPLTCCSYLFHAGMGKYRRTIARVWVSSRGHNSRTQTGMSQKTELHNSK